MSTRGVIARVTGEGTFEGRYHHWDSNPSGLGQTLVELFNGHFKGNLKAMLEFLLDKHPAGWSTINGADFKKRAGYSNSLDTTVKRGPACYCHGARHEEEQIITQDDDAGTEWAYVFDEEREVMYILERKYRSESGDEKHMVGMFGFGVNGQYWADAATIDLNDKSTYPPNWDKVSANQPTTIH